MANVLAVTGHRPDKLGGYSWKAEATLRRFARSELQIIRPSLVITGMALGWDQAIARACVNVGIPFVAAVPFDGQDSRWAPASRDIYRKLLAKATEIVVVSPGTFSVRKMHLRNRYMVDRGDNVLALWNGTDGGTSNCVSYARLKNKPVDNCWSRWGLWLTESQRQDS